MKHPYNTANAWLFAEFVRTSAPLVHNITNLVVQNDTAAAIAAVGGTQITLHTLEEAREAAGISAALAVNIGTLEAQWLQAARTAVQVMTALDRPWVLDPVAVGLTAYRTAAAQEFLGLGPTVLKGNASEILALGEAESLGGRGGRGGRGADAVHTVSEATAAALALARQHGCIVVVSGARDLVTDGTQALTVDNGHPLMARMIGAGCMLTSVLACFLAGAKSPFAATLAAVACFNVAGELAAEQAAGPGTLKPLFIDALFNLDRSALETRMRITPLNPARNPGPDQPPADSPC